MMIMRTARPFRAVARKEMDMVWRTRRVVTGQDAQGRSKIIFDGQAENVQEMESMPGVALTDLWETLSAPADNKGELDAADRPVRLTAPNPGSIFRLVEFPPDSQWRDVANAGTAFASIGADAAPDPHSSDPMRHKTNTIDYIVVIKGEIYAIVDDGEVLLKPGDVFIQRGTMHSWSVRGNEPCVIAVVLVAAEPV
jgi:hypothetical protein